MYRIVAVVGSLRKDSLNRQLADLAAAAVDRDSVVFEIIDYSDVPLFNEDIEYPAPASVDLVRSKIAGADGVWFFTPEYNHYFPGVLKNLIDWLSRPPAPGQRQVMDGKPVAISGVSPGMSGTAMAQDHLVTLLSFLDARIMNAPRLTVPNVMSQVEDGRLTLKASMPYLERQAKAFPSYIAMSRFSGKC
jgi:chromate reductase